MTKKLLILTIFVFISVTACSFAPGTTPTATSSPVPTLTKLPAVEVAPSPTGSPTPKVLSYEPRFEEGDCPFQLPPSQIEGDTVECGVLIVPEERSDPNTASIRLATAIFHPPGGATEDNPIIYLVGGPGASILELLYLSFDLRFAPILESGRDLIMFDQRGVGYSEPTLDCVKATELGYELMDNELDGKLLTDHESAILFDEAFQECAQELGSIADLDAYNTVANAADVNDLRIALGYDKVNLWGGSYGTRLALGAMRDYPEGIRSAILDSTYPPNVDLYLETPANLNRSLTLLFEACEADSACNQAFPDLEQVFFDSLSELTANPVEVNITNPLTGESYTALENGDAIFGLVFQLLYDTEALPLLPQLIYDASNRDFSDISRIQGAIVMQSEMSSRGMMFSVLCNEELAFSSLESLNDALLQYPLVEPFLRQSILGEIGYQVCTYWGAGEAGPEENKPVHSDIPSLVLQGEYDPITPPSWGEQAAETLSNSHYFLFPGVGHGTVATECARDMLIEFVQNPNQAPDDTCITDLNGISFAVPDADPIDVEMQSFSDPAKGISGSAPVGWTEVSPGTYARLSTPLDETVLIVDAAPLDADTILDLLSSQLSFDPEAGEVEEIDYGTYRWKIYAVETEGFFIDLAIAESGNVTYLVLLISTSDERQQLLEQVFMPAVEALGPIE